MNISQIMVNVFSSCGTALRVAYSTALDLWESGDISDAAIRSAHAQAQAWVGR